MGKIALRIQSLPETVAEIYNTFKGHSFYGVYEFLTPMIVLRDPELIKRVTVKDFEHFLDRRNIFSEETEPFFGKSIFNLNGELFIASSLLLLPWAVQNCCAVSQSTEHQAIVHGTEH
jgi:cytochrome P450 family 9